MVVCAWLGGRAGGCVGVVRRRRRGDEGLAECWRELCSLSLCLLFFNSARDSSYLQGGQSWLAQIPVLLSRPGLSPGSTASSLSHSPYIPSPPRPPAGVHTAWVERHPASGGWIVRGEWGEPLAGSASEHYFLHSPNELHKHNTVTVGGRTITHRAVFRRQE